MSLLLALCAAAAVLPMAARGNYLPAGDAGGRFYGVKYGYVGGLAPTVDYCGQCILLMQDLVGGQAKSGSQACQAVANCASAFRSGSITGTSPLSLQLCAGGNNDVPGEAAAYNARYQNATQICAGVTVMPTLLTTAVVVTTTADVVVSTTAGFLTSTGSSIYTLLQVTASSESTGTIPASTVASTQAVGTAGVTLQVPAGSAVDCNTGLPVGNTGVSTGQVTCTLTASSGATATTTAVSFTTSDAAASVAVQVTYASDLPTETSYYYSPTAVTVPVFVPVSQAAGSSTSTQTVLVTVS